MLYIRKNLRFLLTPTVEYVRLKIRVSLIHSIKEVIAWRHPKFLKANIDSA